jgi:hypothetical protein
MIEEDLRRVESRMVLEQAFEMDTNITSERIRFTTLTSTIQQHFEVLIEQFLTAV